MRLELGNPVRCADEGVGVLADLVIDPRAGRVTHLVVEPKHRHALARLVPVELAVRGISTRPALVLRCTSSELKRLPEVNELTYRRLYDLPLKDPDWDVGVQDVLAMRPNRDFPGVGWNLDTGEPRVTVSYDRIPKGEVEIRRQSEVTSVDGWPVGRVTGLVTTDDGHITHLALRRGWLRRPRKITVPIDAVAWVETDAVTLELTKDEVAGDRPHRRTVLDCHRRAMVRQDSVERSVPVADRRDRSEPAQHAEDGCEQADGNGGAEPGPP
jgi:sporulation protein YlmC with PRC-barrel domain